MEIKRKGGLLVVLLFSLILLMVSRERHAERLKSGTGGFGKSAGIIADMRSSNSSDTELPAMQSEVLSPADAADGVGRHSVLSKSPASEIVEKPGSKQGTKGPGRDRFEMTATRMCATAVNFSLDFPRARISNVQLDGEQYQRIVYRDSRVGAIDFGEGTPELPVRKLLVKIPKGSEFDVTDSNLKTAMLGGLILAPTQDRMMDGADESFVKNEDFYESEAWYPESKRGSHQNIVISARTVNLRNERFAEITLALARYQPKNGKVEVVESVDIDLTITSVAERSGSGSILPASRTFEQLIDTGDYDMTHFVSATTNQTPSLPDIDKAHSIPERYLIICNDQYADNLLLDEFIQWKRRKGYAVEKVLTSAIGGATCRNSEINGYLKGLPDSEWPTYLLMIGGNDKNSGVQMHKRNVSYGINTWNDYFYSLRTYTEETGEENWDLANDDGNPTNSAGYVDEYPDLLMGRIPAENEETLNNILLKILQMDRNPPIASSHYQHSIMVGAAGGGLHLPEPCADAMGLYFQESFGDEKSEMAFNAQDRAGGDWVDQSIPRTIWTNDRWQVSDMFAEETEDNGIRDNDPAKAKLKREWNKGAAFVTYICHGGPGGWYWNNKGETFTKSEAAALTNRDKYAFVFDWSCSTADESAELNLTQTLLDDRDGGAYGMIAAPGSQFAGYQDYLCFGFLAGAFDDFLTFFRDYPDTHGYPNFENPPEPLMFNAGAGKRLGQMWWCSKLYALETFPCDRYDIYAFGPRCSRTMASFSCNGTGDETPRSTLSTLKI